MNQTFVDLVQDQFSFGGVKYAAESKKEATDILVEDFGWNWLIGTQAKYVKRFRNLHREKDLLKIACYFYIDWLKLGYHLAPLGSAEIQCTTVPVKAEFFPVFIEQTKEYEQKNLSEDTLQKYYTEENALTELYRVFLDLRINKNKEFLLFGFMICEILWRQRDFDKVQQHDTDTARSSSNGATKT
jgi:hypothetical protein